MVNKLLFYVMRNYSIVFSFFFIGLTLAQADLYAQQTQVVRDVGVRTGLELDYEFKNSFSFSSLIDVRTFYNSTKIESNVVESGLNYEISSHFDLSAQIRYVRNRKKDGFFYHDLRNDFDLKFNTKFGDGFKLKYRMRYQKRYANLMTLSRYKYDKSDNVVDFRNKIQLEYKFNKKNKVYLGFELFREYELYRRPHFNKYRITVGDKVKLNSNVLEVGLMYDREWSETEPFHFFVLNLYYEFSFKKK